MGLRGVSGKARGFDGDHDECADPQRQWTKTLVHNTLVDAVMRFCKDCGMVDVQSEVKYWDPRRIGSDGSRRVPDVVCFHPHTGVEYVIDVRMFWQVLTDEISSC